jgi:hypothetical protein
MNGPLVHDLATDHLPRRASALRCRTSLVGALVALLVSALLTGSLGPAAPGAHALGDSPLVDAPSPYEGQTTCTKAPRPGTVALANWLMGTYKRTGSMGMMRACGSGGTSEHKDGRAFDWKADVRKKATRRAAYDFIKKALAPDAAGNAHALARRMGIMYIIYDDTIWSSYRDFVPRPYLNAGCKKRKKCSRTLRHLDHVHISLGYAGAAAQTSWYRSRGVAAEPVLHPGTEDLDATETAVTGMTVPANGTVATSSFYLRPGVTYRIVATGSVVYDAGVTGDANCSVTPDNTLAPTSRGPLVTPILGLVSRFTEGSRHPATPYSAPLPETHGLLVNGALRWDGTCQADHTYEGWFTPDTRQRLQVQYADAVPGDNTGSFQVYVARDDITRVSLVG